MTPYSRAFRGLKDLREEGSGSLGPHFGATLDVEGCRLPLLQSLKKLPWTEVREICDNPALHSPYAAGALALSSVRLWHRRRSPQSPTCLIATKYNVYPSLACLNRPCFGLLLEPQGNYRLGFVLAIACLI